jgi:predicted N-formylglutamate amidohydrolase
MNPSTGRRAGLSVLHRLKLVDQLVDYAIAKLVAHCDHQTDCQPLDDRRANAVLDPLQIADHVCHQIGLVQVGNLINRRLDATLARRKS